MLGRSCASRALRDRPTLAKLYRLGRLGWSKIRALARVVNEDNEIALCAMALEATAAEVARSCEGLRTGRAPADVDDEIAADRQRFLGRTGGWHELADGSVALRFVLPPDMAANAIGALQAMEDRLFRADAADAADWYLLEGASARTKAIAHRVGMHRVRVRIRRARPDEATAAGVSGECACATRRSGSSLNATSCGDGSAP